MILDDEDILIEKSKKNNLQVLINLLYESYCDNDVIQDSLNLFLNKILKDYLYNSYFGSININKKNLEYAGCVSYGFQYFQDSRVMLNITIYCKEIDIFNNIFYIDKNEYIYIPPTRSYLYKTTYIFPTKKTS